VDGADAVGVGFGEIADGKYMGSFLWVNDDPAFFPAVAREVDPGTGAGSDIDKIQAGILVGHHRAVFEICVDMVDPCRSI